MIAELLIPIFDKCIELLKIQGERKLQFLDNIVAPVYEQFDLLHKDYLETFKAYKEQIVDAEDFSAGIDKLLQNIHDDNLFTTDQRVKALELVNAINISTNPRYPTDKKGGLTKLDDRLLVFVFSICEYLGKADNWSSDASDSESIFSELMLRQRWRNSFADIIKEVVKTPKISDDSRKKVVVFYLEATVSNMQRSYYDVTAAYMLVRAELLKAVY